ncbi:MULTISPECIES: radical SAM protein [unclassified Lacrimispora]|uniref:radical SAM protein n=1 Tax=unclassified Lacrimispora TaxID=2719232 RepID=UPI0037703112
MLAKCHVDLGIPFHECNLNCHYCYVGQRGDKVGRGHTSETELRYPIPHMVKALSVDRLGGKSIINLCASGETLLPPYILELIQGLLMEGHYITVVTNATLTERFREIALMDEMLLERLFFKCSFHFLELKRKNLMDTFFRNLKSIREMGASFTVELCASDELEPYIDEIKEICMREVGAYPHVVIPRTDDTKELLSKHTLAQFKDIWKVFDSTLFDFKAKYWGEKRTEFCRAGEYEFLVNGGNGNYSKCYKQGVTQNLFEDLSKPILFEPVGFECKMTHCFNAHIFLGFGCIGEIHDATYKEMRDRIDVNTGKHWLNPTMREVFNHFFSEYGG